MVPGRVLRIYLEPDECQRARDGGFPFMTKIKLAFEKQGYRVDFVRNSDEERIKSVARRGYALFFMDDPFHSRALTLRRAYFYPFWRIENTARRWEFRVARKLFDPGEIDTETAKKWADDWRKWIFRGKAADPVREGVVYVPLQGRLLEHRSFQTMSPLDMVRETIAREPKRQILIGLHPGETYEEAELAPLHEIAAENPRVSLQTGGMEEALRVCDYVITQNSAAALFGFFFQKPAVLFARIDFHHIAANVAELGVGKAFETVRAAVPNFDAYLYWFIQLNSIKADEENAGDRILETVRGFGWTI